MAITSAIGKTELAGDYTSSVTEAARRDTFAARMVHEGIELFGPTVSGTVTDAAGPGVMDDTAEGSAGNQPDSAGGCSISISSSLWVVIALGVLLPRRRTS